MQAEEPPLTGRQLLDLKSIVSCIPADLEQYERALGEISRGWASDSDGGRKRVKNPHPCPSPVGGRGVDRGKKAARVLLTGVPLVHGAERVLDLIEECGGLVVAMENCTGLKPLMEEITVGGGDPLAALAETYFHLPCSVMTPNTRRLDLLRRLIREYRPACVIEVIWQGCLTYDVESVLVRQVVQDEFGLGYLKITTDYSPSDSSRLSTRIEALLETAI